MGTIPETWPRDFQREVMKGAERWLTLGPVDLDVQLQFLSGRLDVLETLLVVGAGTTDPNLDVVLDQDGSEFPQGTDDTLEGGGDVLFDRSAARSPSWGEWGAYGEVGNTTSDEEDAAFGVLVDAEHQVEHCPRVQVRLALAGSTRVLSVVGQLAGEAGGGDGVGVHNGSTTTSNQSPHTTDGVQHGQLERGTGLRIERRDVTIPISNDRLGKMKCKLTLPPWSSHARKAQGTPMEGQRRSRFCRRWRASCRGQQGFVR